MSNKNLYQSNSERQNLYQNNLLNKNPNKSQKKYQIKKPIEIQKKYQIKSPIRNPNITSIENQRIYQRSPQIINNSEIDRQNITSIQNKRESEIKKSNMIKIKTLKISSKDLVREIRNKFNLNEPIFNDIDDDLLLLAFTPKCNGFSAENRSNKNIFNKKYNTCDFESLEFYGDIILYNVINEIIYDIFGLSANPGLLTDIKQYLTNNRILTDIMLNKNGCELLRIDDYKIEEKSKFHNYCSDAFEALIGALFIHLHNKNIDYINPIKNWIIKNTDISDYIYEYLNDIQIYNRGIFKGIKNKEIIENLEIIKNNELNNLENLRINDDITEEMYNDFKNSIIEKYNDDILKINPAIKSLVIDINTDIKTIFNKLHWKYELPIYMYDYDIYYFYGYPNNIKTLIGVGDSKESAIEDGIQYLLTNGYIIFTKPLNKIFIK